ncbi:heme peroxidase [Zopfochytrium polystomum]|nr:heme peroxidase [Zopfochytrium polystomum]
MHRLPLASPPPAARSPRRRQQRTRRAVHSASLLKSLLAVAAATSASAAGASASPTWPSPTYDRFEDLLYQESGYASFGFITVEIEPCTHAGAGAGFISAAAWVRTAFHDMITHDAEAGTGGVDASLRWELNRTDENRGSAFTSTLDVVGRFHDSVTPLADLVAMALVTAVGHCGGPRIPLRVGRVDAGVAGPKGVPSPDQSAEEFAATFRRAGFSLPEAIAMVACGHTMGGVHGTLFPTVVPDDGSFANRFHPFDASPATFDDSIVTAYVGNVSTDPLVDGPDAVRRSDARLFAADGNRTVRAMAASPGAFAATCAEILGRMIETVPAAVRLTEPVAPYEVKPRKWRLLPAADGSLLFSGDVRVRVTERPVDAIAGVTLELVDRSAGGCVDAPCSVPAVRQSAFDGVGKSGLGNETFVYYGFARNVTQAASVTSVRVRITLTDGTEEVHDNNGDGFPLQDRVLVDDKQSCRDFDGKIVAAVHKSLDTTATPVLLSYWLATDTLTGLPFLVPGNVTMEPYDSPAASASNDYRYFVGYVPLNGSYPHQTNAVVSVGEFADSQQQPQRRAPGLADPATKEAEDDILEK